MLVSCTIISQSRDAYEWEVIDSDFTHHLVTRIYSYSLAVLQTYLGKQFDVRYAVKMLAQEMISHHRVDHIPFIDARHWQNNNLPEYFKNWKEISAIIDDELGKLILLM